MKLLTAVLLGIVLGIVIIGLARFAFAPSQHAVHYHANWSVYVDGQRLNLSDARYMEDVAACAAGDQVSPRERVHMHNGEDHVVHVHHEGVSWGHFLQNLGFASGPGLLVLGDGRTLGPDESRTLKYIVNGFEADDVTGRMIRRGDRLLISYGPENVEAVMAGQYPEVPADARQYDEMNDPSTCAGETHVSVGARLRRAFLW